MLLISLLSLLTTASPALAQDLCSRAVSNPLLHRASYGFDDPRVLRSLELTQEERVEIACQMKSAILRLYSLIDLKKERIGIDAETHLSSCVRDEVRVKNDSRLTFLNRMRRCVAAFQDTHFVALPKVNNPAVFVGVELGLVEDKVVIVSTMPRLLRWFEQRDRLSGLTRALSVGAEVIEVDGVAPDVWIEEFMAYTSASSEDARRQRAARAILLRNFLYPKRNFVELKVKLSDGKVNTIRLPWVTSSQITNVADANAEFKRLGIPSYDGLRWVFNTEKNEWEPVTSEWKGFSMDDPLVDSKLITTLKNGDREIVRTAEVLLDRRRAFCYLQLLSFGPSELELPNKTKRAYVEAVKPFLEECERKELPLLIDLRSNPGGNSDHATKLMAALTRKDEVSSSYIRGLRATKHAAMMHSALQSATAPGARVIEHEDTFDRQTRELTDALRTNQKYTRLIVGPKIEPSLKNGFNQPIVALVSTDCVSACDNMAGYLKSNKRATLIGTSSNGTGAGFIGVSNLSGDFTDTYNILSLGIPVSLFGMAGSTELPEAISYSKGKHLISENQPHVADIPHNTKISDLTKNGQSWLDKAVEVLFKE